MKNVTIVLLAVILLCIMVTLGISYKLEQMTRINAARIEEARAQQETAIARQIEAQKEKALYDAAGYAIQVQADLVRYYAQRGDIRVATVWQWVVGLALAGFIIWYALRRPAARLPSNDDVLLKAPGRSEDTLS